MTRDEGRGGWRPIGEADRKVPLIVGVWVDDENGHPPRWSSWTVNPGEPLGCDGTWGDDPTHAHALPAPPAPETAEVDRG